jgi:Spy/CpxP family protein refolding chaperone
MKVCNRWFSGVVGVCVWSAAAAAQPMGPPHGHMMRGGGPGGMMGEGPSIMLPLVLKHANLTPEQTDQVHKIMETDHDGLRTLFKQLQAANDELANKLFAAGSVQAADLVPSVQRITQLRQQLMEQGLKTALAIRAVLKPDQLAKVAQLKARVDNARAEMRSILEEP